MIGAVFFSIILVFALLLLCLEGYFTMRDEHEERKRKKGF
jgi:hypothetical protein